MPRATPFPAATTPQQPWRPAYWRDTGISVGGSLVLALLGLGGGYAVGQLTREQPTTVAVAAPVPAQDPSYPVDPEKPYAEDISYPALLPGLTYRRVTLGDVESAEESFELLMGNDVTPRREFLVASASRVDRDAIDA